MNYHLSFHFIISFVVKDHSYLLSSLGCDSARSGFSVSVLRHCSIRSGKRDVKTLRWSLTTASKDFKKNRASVSILRGSSGDVGSCGPLCLSAIAPRCTTSIKALSKSSMQTCYFNIQTCIFKWRLDYICCCEYLFHHFWEKPELSHVTS